MDRLEKALEKARQARQEAHAVVATPPVSSSPVGEGAPRPGPAAGLVPVDAKVFERNRLFAQRQRDNVADIFRILRSKVLQIISKSNIRTFAVTSANYGDGKSTVALNLAISLAADVKQTVLVVDLDLRKPSIHEYLGITPNAGLADYFMRDVPVPQCLVRPEIERLVVLPVNGAIDNSSELLGTPRMAALALELKERYADRIVIYDMPPLLVQDDVIAFLPNVDGVLLVAREGKTTQEDLTQCLYDLQSTNLVGVVLNDTREKMVPV
ncbi:P-loop NTPase [Pararhodospirillum oryzae]|uniref:Polysaccharide biosynthesis protein n=1 Tax=Pararhodospirillum oryzae TaxID=478448 RepID=A0A512H3T2_9PROT|nr:P-loop NTPase [Pararhodospirillum oryzae]GEO80126.1 polysaccharide biosynthesis protein [Pararhodospirillum oryzae]